MSDEARERFGDVPGSVYGEANGEFPDYGWSHPSLQRRKVCHAYSGHHRGDDRDRQSDGRVLSDTDALMSAVSARFGSLDLLFLNAGIFRPAPVAEVTEESFDEHADLNFKGQHFTLQKALPS